MTVSILEEIKKYYEEKVLRHLKLKLPNDNNIKDYKLAAPSAHVGWIPPKGTIDGDKNISIPCIVIGLDNKLSSGRSTLIKLRISVAIYEPGLQDNDKNYSPDLSGYQTLLNVMDKIEAVTLKNKIIAKKYELASDIEIAMYEEQPYPYWYGYLMFSVKAENYPETRYTDFL